jgi:hypothetical protein
MKRNRKRFENLLSCLWHFVARPEIIKTLFKLESVKHADALSKAVRQNMSNLLILWYQTRRRAMFSRLLVPTEDGGIRYPFCI